MSKKERTTTYTTPKGEAIWPHLNRPDEKYGDYKVKMAFDAEDPEVQKLMKQIDEANEAAYREQIENMPKAKAKGYSAHCNYEMELDEEGEEETGRVLISFKAKAEFKDRKTGEMVQRTIKIFPASGGKQLKNPPFIRHGSILKIAFMVSNSWANPTSKTAGVSLYIQAVQIIELAEGSGGGSASAFGFGEEEGYEPDYDDAPFDQEEDGSDEPAPGDAADY